MDRTMIEKRLKFHTERLDNLYAAYNALVTAAQKATGWMTANSPDSTLTRSAMKLKMPSGKSRN